MTNISSPSLNLQYQYDGLFNRVSKTDSGTTAKYLVDPNGFLPQVIAEMDAAYNITSYYVYDGIGLVAKMSGSNGHYYHYNGSGNTIAMTDSNGNMVNKYAYDEFGNLMNAAEAVPNPFLYVGRFGVMDDDNGLLYMRARYYDPQVGRFVSKDPIRYLGRDPNLYCYVSNNAVNLGDPSGLLINFGTAALGAGIGAVTGGISAFMSTPNATWYDVMRGAGIGAGYGALAGFSLGGSIIVNAVAGAAVGVAADVTAQGLGNKNQCRPFFSGLDVESLVISGITGLVTGGAGAQYLKWGATALDALLFSSAGSFGIEVMLRTQVRYAR